jgi:hypothetical protein
MRNPRHGSPVQVYMTPELKALLAELAERNMRTMSAEVVIALLKHLRDEGLGDGRPVPKSAPAPQAPPKKARGKKRGVRDGAGDIGI